MFVEDLITKLHQIECHKLFPGMVPHTSAGEWRFSFLNNVSSRVHDGGRLSTEQARIALKIARSSVADLINHGVDPAALQQLLDNPVYRNEPYQSANIPREVHYIGEDKLAFRFKYDKIVIDALKQRVGPPKTVHAADDMYPNFNDTHRIWIITVTRNTLQPIIDFIKEQRFQFDDDVVTYLAECTEVRNAVTSFTLDPESNQIVATVRDNEVLMSWVRTALGGQTL